MTLPEAVVILNREIEKFAIEQDYTTLQKLSFVRNQIVNHTCNTRRGKKK